MKNLRKLIVTPIIGESFAEVYKDLVIHFSQKALEKKNILFILIKQKKRGKLFFCRVE